jgi:hypothetical protein
MGEDMETASNVRLVITHMELENFKSYAGVQRIGPFHKVRPVTLFGPSVVESQGRALQFFVSVS